MDTNQGIALATLLTALVTAATAALALYRLARHPNISGSPRGKRPMPSYRLPTFNLTCDIGAPAVANGRVGPMAAVRVAGQACQLTYGHRTAVAGSGGTPSQGTPMFCLSLLLPPGTDVRGPQDTVSHDLVEVPAGSGRLYWVVAVDDIGKGFLNEHRLAYLLACEGSWVAPYP